MSENYTNPDINGDTAYASIKAMMVDGKPTDIQRHYLIPKHFPPLTKEALDYVLSKDWEALLTSKKVNVKLPANGKVGCFVERNLGANIDKDIRSYKRKQSGYDYKLGKS